MLAHILGSIVIVKQQTTKSFTFCWEDDILESTHNLFNI